MRRFKLKLHDEPEWIFPFEAMEVGQSFFVPTLKPSPMLYAIELQQYLDNINWGNVARKGRDVALEVVSAQMNPFNRIIDFNNIPNYPIRPQTPPPSPTVGGGGVGQQHGTPGY